VFSCKEVTLKQVGEINFLLIIIQLGTGWNPVRCTTNCLKELALTFFVDGFFVSHPYHIL